MAPIRQTNFSAGELAPEYWGRTDLDKFSAGLRTMLNFFPSVHGAAVSRPGTQWLGATKFADTYGTVNLLPFNYSDTQALLLEVGDEYIRFWLDGALVVDPDLFLLPYNSNTNPNTFAVGEVVEGDISGATGVVVADIDHLDPPGTGTLLLDEVTGTFDVAEGLTGSITGIAIVDSAQVLAGDPLEVVTPYQEADVLALQWAQSGDILTLVHPGYAPQELKRFANDIWTLTPLSTIVSQGFGATSSAGGAYLKAALPTPTTAEPALPWKWALTVIYRNEDGVLTETGPFFITKSATAYPATGLANLPATVAVYPDLPVTLFLPMPTGANQFAANSGLSTANPILGRPVSIGIFRGYGAEMMGWIGEVDWLQQQWIDNGQAPNYAIQPPRGQNPFEVYSTAVPPTLVRTEKPSSVAYFEDRLCFGGTLQRPELFLASSSGDYHNFDEHFLLLASDSLSFNLNARRRAYIHSLCPLERLLAFTSTSVWAISGQQGNPLQFDSVDAKMVEEVGANTIPALTVNGAALYVRAKGRGVRAVLPANTRSGYAGTDLSVLASHLFDTEEVLAWTYAEDPWGVVWAVSSDGMLLSLTFVPEQQTWAWARHGIKGGSPLLPSDPEYTDDTALVSAVCAIPEGEEDAVYLVVDRGAAGRSLERFSSRRILGAVDDRAPLDGSVRIENPDVRTFITYTPLEPVAPFTVGQVVTGGFSGATGTILSDSGTVLELGTVAGLFTAGEGITDPLTGEGTDIVVARKPTVPDLVQFTGFQVYAVDAQTGVIYGPFLVDGTGLLQFTVNVPTTDGDRILDIGLPFNADLGLLDLAETQVRNKQKTVKSVGFEVTASRGLKAGPDFDTLTTAQVLSTDEESGLSLVRANTLGGFGPGGRAVLRQTLPIPVTVVGITREVDVGG